MDLSEPKSGALVSLFSPSLYWMKTVIKLFSTGCRRVFSVDWKTSSGGGEVGRWGGGEELTRSGTWGRCSHNNTQYWWIEVYTRAVSLVSQWNNTPESYGLLLYLLFKFPGMTAYPTVFPQRFNLLCLA